VDVRGKVALVTGAGSGIGLATARRLAREGAIVYVVDREVASVTETARLIAGDGGEAVAVAVDVTDGAALAATIARAEREHGGLDIMVNNAGVMTGQPYFPETPAAQWNRTVDINLRAVILGTQLAIPALERRGGGAISSTASLAGVVGLGTDPVYAATKAAVIFFTRSLEPLSRRRGIRVNCVCPGSVDTPMLRHYGNEPHSPEAARREQIATTLPKLSPDDIADAHFALICDETMAGQALQVAYGLPRLPIPVPTLESLMAAGG
jgi:NAD(P)-dependent dehydrogenase (short-subunit alcohol dehydrogenase family)